MLPKALRSEINGDAKVKEKAGVSEVTTVQQWAHGTLYGFNIKLPEPMPNLTIDSYSAVTFAPVKEEVDADGKTKKIGYWDPFFKGQSGAKVVLTYINDDESSQAQGGASGIVTHNAKYTVVQDSTKKKHHWSVEPIDAEDYDSAVTRIKRRASNVVIMPIKPIPSATPVERQNSGTILRGDDTLKGQAPKGAAVAPAYGKASVNGPHRVDTEGTVHVQMRVIPIDVSGIKSEDELSNYMKRLGKMVIELAEIGAKQLVEPQQSTALKEKVDPTPAAPAAATAKKVEMKKPELIKHAEWLANYARDKISTAATDFFGNLFSAPKN